MRLIDKDALVREFAEFVRRYNNSDFAPVPTWNDAVALLACSPTIEAEPVRRGYWYVEPGIGRKCSVCDFDIGNDLDYMDYVNYCPSCGAKMEEQGV